MAKSSTSQFTVRLEDSLLGVRDDGDSKMASIAREVFKEEVAKIVIERLISNG